MEELIEATREGPEWDNLTAKERGRIRGFDRFTCESCGGIYSRYNINKHAKTAKHQRSIPAPIPTPDVTPSVDIENTLCP